MPRKISIVFLLFVILPCSGSVHASLDRDPVKTVPVRAVEESFPVLASAKMETSFTNRLRTSETKNRRNRVTSLLRMKGVDQPFKGHTSTSKWWSSHSLMTQDRERAALLENERRTYYLPTGYVTYEELLSSKTNAFYSALSEINILLQFAGAGYHFVGPENINGWSPGSFDNISRGLSTTPQWDSDNFLINYAGHPYAGSVFYLIARNRGLGILGSWLVSTCGSFLWEYYYEAFYEVPSANDLLFTSNVGSLIGELSWQLKKILVKSNKAKPTRCKDVLIFVADPWDAVVKKLNLGPLWSASRNPINPYNTTIPSRSITQRWED